MACIALGVLCAFILYRRDSRLTEVASWLKGLLAFLRALVVTLIAMLLLGPLLSSLDSRVEKPVVIVAQDNSNSLLLNKDSVFYKGQYLSDLSKLMEDIGENYEVESYIFDKEVTNGNQVDFSGKQTNMSSMLESIYDRNSNRNLGALILATDGVYNIGANPNYVAQKLQAPIFTVAMGDTTVKQDLILENVAHNRLAYLGNDFPLEVLMRADRFKGQQTLLKVTHNGETLFSRTVDIDKDGFLKSTPIQLNAKEVGRQRYDISLSPLAGELSTSNNYRSIYIDVIDSRQKILILARAPHPDIAAIRKAVESNQNYEAEVHMASRFVGDLSEYDLVILHHLPSGGSKVTKVLSEADRLSKPILYFAGLKTDYGVFNGLNSGASVSVKQGNNTTDASPGYNKSFSLFTVDDEVVNLLSKLPPLTTAFGEFSSSNSAETLFNQRIGTVDTEQPLILFNDLNGRKSGVICGEGIWRWRLIDHLENGNHEVFNGLIGKMVQYLATKEDKRLFRVYAKDRYNEDQNILIEAEFYNKSLELINEPEVSILIKNSEGAEFPFTFSQAQNSYILDAGRLPVGDYTYVARTSLNGESFSASGEFVVTALLMEAINTTADHQLLYAMSQSTGGELVYPQELSKLAEMIKSKKEITPIMYSTKQLSELINMKWIFFLFLALLSIEWFVRKYNGAY